MIVGDGGKPEVVVEPGKSPFLTPDTDTLMTAAPGTKVYPDVETYAKINGRAQAPVPMEVNVDMNRDLLQKQVKKLDIIASVLKNQPRPVGPKRTRTGQAYTDYVNRNIFN